MSHTVLVRIQYDILHSGSGTRGGDSRNGGERHRRCPRKRGPGGDIVEPPQHEKDGSGTSQRDRLLTEIFAFMRDTKIMHKEKLKQLLSLFVIAILCICRNGIRDVLRPRHHSYPLHLYHVASLRCSDGNRNRLKE